MGTTWVRMTRSCDNRCVFCNQRDELTGEAVQWEIIEEQIQGAEGPIFLSGGEPTRSPHLLKAIRLAKARGLHTTLVTNGRMLRAPKVCKMLLAAGLDEVRVSLHSGRRTTHDQLVGRTGAWVESLAGLRMAAREGLYTVLQGVLTAPAKGEWVYLQHMVGMGDVKHLRVRRLETAGLDDELKKALTLTTSDALGLVSELWHEGKEDLMTLTTHGLAWHEVVPPKEASSHQPDANLLHLLRQGVRVKSAMGGLAYEDPDGRLGPLRDVCRSEAGGLPRVAWELEGYGTPLTEAPKCMGGMGTAGEGGFSADCDGCPVRATCAGIPAKAGRVLKPHLAPRRRWMARLGTQRIHAVGPNADNLLQAVRSAGGQVDAEAPTAVLATTSEAAAAWLAAHPSAQADVHLWDDGRTEQLGEHAPRITTVLSSMVSRASALVDHLGADAAPQKVFWSPALSAGTLPRGRKLVVVHTGEPVALPGGRWGQADQVAWSQGVQAVREALSHAGTVWWLVPPPEDDGEHSDLLRLMASVTDRPQTWVRGRDRRTLLGLGPMRPVSPKRAAAVRQSSLWSGKGQLQPHVGFGYWLRALGLKG